MSISTKNQLLRELLEGITIEQLQHLVDLTPVPAPRTVKRSVSAPRKSVKQMVQEYEESIITPPLEFRDEYKPIPKPRTRIKQTNKGLKGFTKSFEINININRDPLVQLQCTGKAIVYQEHVANNERIEIR